MKTNKRLDEAIKCVSRAIDSTTIDEDGKPQMRSLIALLEGLRWARGYRATSPEVMTERLISKMRYGA
jgi:hypothetical protein